MTKVKPTPLSMIRLYRTGGKADLRSLAKLSAGYLLALIVPRRMDQWVLRRFVGTSLGVRKAMTQRVEGRMRQVLGPYLPDADFKALAIEYCEMAREIQWLRMRAFHTTALPMETSVEGLERVAEARDVGRGVILWGMSFCESLPVKVALQRAGLDIVHLSSAQHGVASPHTDLGLQIVGPLHNAPENPFLRERLIIPADESLGYVRVLKKRLSDNGCVYIRGDIHSVRTNVVAMVCGREANFAPGAPGLSLQLGSPLLPIHVVRDGPFRYRAVIHPPVDVDRGLDKKQFVRKAVDQFAELIEASALESPSSWEYARAIWTNEWDA
jgi:lauroyl/myristoyl acyltransferase